MITIIIGLPGSGKTHLTQNTYSHCIILDDCEGNAKDKQYILDNRDKDIVISHPVFCDKYILNSLLNWLDTNNINERHLIYYANSPEQCLINASTRPNKNVNSYIKQLSKIYEPIDPIPVFANII
jgi:adenylate kinase family enzyme